MSIKIKAVLKKAGKQDLFNKNGVVEHLALFYLSQIDGKLYGAYYTSDDTDYVEILIKQDIGMIYILNFDVPAENDITIELDFTIAEAFDIKKTSNSLKIRKPYYIKEGDVLTGPFFLTSKTDPGELKTLLQNNLLYMITSNQTINELAIKKEVA